MIIIEVNMGMTCIAHCQMLYSLEGCAAYCKRVNKGQELLAAAGSKSMDEEPVSAHVSDQTSMKH